MKVVSRGAPPNKPLKLTAAAQRPSVGPYWARDPTAGQQRADRGSRHVER